MKGKVLRRMMNKGHNAMRKTLIVITLIAFATVFLLSACTKGDADAEADMNTVRPHELTDEENDLVEMYTPNETFRSIVQFTVDESYKHVIAGYDYYENGKLIKEDVGEMMVDFSYEDGPQISYGKISTIINDDDKDIKVMVSGSESGESNILGSGSSLTNDEFTFGDMSTFTTSELGEDVKIETNRKIPIWAYIGYNDDNLSVPDLNTMMGDKNVFGSYDKCCLFYAKFVTK